MKYHLASRITLVAATLACASGLIPGCRAGQDPPQNLISPKDTRVSISGGALYLNGVRLQLPGPAQEVVKILGKPDRESRLANTILTWDNLGIYVHVEPGSQQANQFTVVFGKEDMPFTSKKAFAGRVSIDETEITPEATAEQIKAATNASGEFFVSTLRGEGNRLVYFAIGSRKGASEGATAGKEAATSPNPRIMTAADGDPLIQLAGDWALDSFVVGGGGDGFSGDKCGNVTIASPDDGVVSVSASCGDAGDYSFRLKRGSEPQTYLITVKSKPGISIDDVPVAYVDGQGWIGSRDQRLDGATQSITARVAAIAGRNWYGWAIEVLPTSELNGNPEEMKIAYFKADLTRRK